MPFPGIRVTASAAADALKAWAPTILIAVASAAAGVAWTRYDAQTSPAAAAVVAAEKAGRAYPRSLGVAYAGAWRKGADALDAGRGIAEALGEVAEAWRTGRTSLFDEAVAPHFAAVIPEGKPDAEISPAERAALAAAWRGFAAGLEKSK